MGEQKLELMSFNLFLMERNYWGKTGAGILPFCPRTKRFLLARRSAHVMEPNTWGTWGGKVEIVGNETLEEAALREFKEESKYNGQIKLKQLYVFNDPGKFTYTNFLGTVPEEFEAKLNWETSGAYWMTFDRINDSKSKHFGLTDLFKHSGSYLKSISSGTPDTTGYLDMKKNKTSPPPTSNTTKPKQDRFEL